MDKGKNFKYGLGIYSTPDPSICRDCAQVIPFNGELYKVIIQNRVNMADTTVVGHVEYYVTPKTDNNCPYGLLFKKVESRERECKKV